MQSGIRQAAISLIMITALFATGWWTGLHSSSIWRTVKQATADSYLNRYRVMSDAGLTSIVYYVSTKDASPLYAMAETSADILDVSATRVNDLYDVRINYSSRVPTVKLLRAMQNVDAVITVPMICH